MNLSREPLRSNVELKARIDDRDAAIDVARALGAVDQGEEEQEDTYFSLGRYRLKLRESSTGKHWLIGYSRPDGADARKSQYRLSPVTDPSGMRLLMGKQWGVKVVVRKWRRVFLWEGRVRIHLDRVETLGDFLEFEAVLPVVGASAGCAAGHVTGHVTGDAAGAEPVTDGVTYDNDRYDECAALLDVARLQHDFGIEDRDLVSTSYSTLIEQSSEIPSGT